MAAGQFCLKWNNFHNSIVSAFESLQSLEELVDVTLMCEGHNVKAHKVILSACSPYFRNLFKETPCQHPIIILKDVLHCDLLAILQFMYQGEVLVEQDGLASFLKTAELLQVSGLAGGNAPSAATCLTESLSVPSKTVPAPTKKENSTSSRSPSPERPQPPPLKHRTTECTASTDHVEKENRTESEVDLEPMQSCSYQTSSGVIIKTEAMDEADFHDMKYNVLGHDSLDDPGPTSDEQSILERSLKAQGRTQDLDPLQFTPPIRAFRRTIPLKSSTRSTGQHSIFWKSNTSSVEHTRPGPRRRKPGSINYGKFPSRMPATCPNCFRTMSQARSLKTHLLTCKLDLHS